MGGKHLRTQAEQDYALMLSDEQDREQEALEDAFLAKEAFDEEQEAFATSQAERLQQSFGC